ncbi:MAG: YlmC/YmxH family sporulation protein [Firmicutes bacterium]|nr:YlmC/YmxH family sporulation protein [Bacillota bacterium]
MYLSELAYKKIINIYDGEILGVAGESDLLIDPEDGRILEIIAPPAKSFSFFGGGERRQIAIPWPAVKKIGSEVIVVDVDENGKYIR